ncbi:MAG: hypothetical protein IT461_05090 [Planctomycetes bacterium]|jgi:hypothetical protein|nr:hypothetical protein [Planctomycetota bacterium]
MTRMLAVLALLTAMAAPIMADVPPSKGKCSTSEEQGLFVGACLLMAAAMLAWRTLKRSPLGRS